MKYLIIIALLFTTQANADEASDFFALSTIPQLREAATGNYGTGDRDRRSRGIRNRDRRQSTECVTKPNRDGQGSWTTTCR